MGCLRTLSTRGNVDTESLAAPSDSNWSVRFQETGDPFAELAHADFDRRHRDAPHAECTLMCTHWQACQDSRGSCSGSVPWSRRGWETMTFFSTRRDLELRAASFLDPISPGSGC